MIANYSPIEWLPEKYKYFPYYKGKSVKQELHLHRITIFIKKTISGNYLDESSVVGQMFKYKNSLKKLMNMALI